MSSSAHLALLPGALGWGDPPDRTAFAAALHAGSTVGIAFALRGEVRALLTTAAGRRRLRVFAATCLPAAVAGLLVHEQVERRLGGDRTTAVLLGAAGAAMALADRRAQDVVDVRGREAAAAAAAQLLALAPGVSRHGATLTALRAMGVERSAAARFSLLMSLPVTGGAALVPLARADTRTLQQLVPLLSAAVPAAAVSGGLAAAGWRRRPGGGLAAPAVYRLALAALVLARRPSRSRAG